MSATVAKVYVVVLNWNHASDTVACVNSVLNSDYANFAVVVCDNASRSDDVAVLRKWGAGLPHGLPEYNAAPSPDWPAPQPRPTRSCVLLHTGANLGFAGGMNVGMRYALAQGDCDYVWVLNNDTEVAVDALHWLVDRTESDKRIGICGSSLIEYHERSKVQALGGAAYLPWRARSIALGVASATQDIPADPAAVESQMAYVIGASMLVTREYLDRVGLMEESYFLYSEEHDWAERRKPLGFRLGYAPRSMVFHQHGATIGTDPSGGSTLSLFYLYRSKVMFAARHHPLLLPLALSFLSWEGVKFFLKQQPGKGKAVFRGIAAAAVRRQTSGV